MQSGVKNKSNGKIFRWGGRELKVILSGKNYKQE
jgi:hypothetical protein